ncbi:Transcriptional regulator [Pseudomonas sp. IT-196MI5]
MNTVGGAMRIYCKECGGKGRIASREELSLEFAKLYCQCLSASCGHTWVATLTFSHTLSPSAQVADRLIFDRLRAMPRAEQRDLFDQLGALAS